MSVSFGTISIWGGGYNMHLYLTKSYKNESSAHMLDKVLDKSSSLFTHYVTCLFTRVMDVV